MQRLFVPDALATSAAIEPSPEQVHYLANVLRLAEGAELLVFNGRDGEWLARVAEKSRRRLTLAVTGETRPQPPPGDLLYCFAPLKQGRLDFLVQKAVEMGAGILQPVMTQHTQGQAPKRERIEANAREAAEQCGILSLPAVRDAVNLDALLDGWDAHRLLVFCDEGAETDNPLPALQAARSERLALMVGPEGGFSEGERQRLRGLPFVLPIPLGPRILRADTAAVAALAVLQATLGDW